MEEEGSSSLTTTGGDSRETSLSVLSGGEGQDFSGARFQVAGGNFQNNITLTNNYIYYHQDGSALTRQHSSGPHRIRGHATGYQYSSVGPHSASGYTPSSQYSSGPHPVKDPLAIQYDPYPSTSPSPTQYSTQPPQPLPPNYQTKIPSRPSVVETVVNHPYLDRELDAHHSVIPMADENTLFAHMQAKVEGYPRAYIRNMISKGEGLPCWNPSRPSEVKEIVPGDVGTVGIKQTFKKLFNLWEDEDAIMEFLSDEESYLPFRELVDRDDHHFVEGYALYCGANSSVTPLPRGGWSFHVTPRNAEGAYLAITSPASIDTLTEGCSQAVGDFIKQNADGLYNFARTRGLQEYTDSLYFVTSCIKTHTWGMASFFDATKDSPGSDSEWRSDMKLEGPAPLPYEPNQTGYTWTQMRDFGRFCTSRPGGVPDVRDQPLFLEGWKLATSEQYRRALRRKSKLPYRPPGDGHGDGSGSSSFGRSSHQGYGPQLEGPSSSMNISGSSHGYAGHGGHGGGQGRTYSSGQEVGEERPSDQELVRSLLQTLKTNHPSDFLNKLMLLEFDASYALTHDNDWKFTLKGLRWDKNGFMALMDALQNDYPFEYRNGIAFLKNSWAPSEAAAAEQRAVDGNDVPGTPALPPIEPIDTDHPPSSSMDNQAEDPGKVAPATHFPYVYSSQHLQPSSSGLQEGMEMDIDELEPSVYWQKSDAAPPAVLPPTPAEDELATELLSALNCDKEWVLTAEAVRAGGLSSNAFSETELHSMLAMSDPEHSGILTKTEVIMALRMMGWATNGYQPAGVPLDTHPGSLPKIVVSSVPMEEVTMQSSDSMPLPYGQSQQLQVQPARQRVKVSLVFPI